MYLDCLYLQTWVFLQGTGLAALGKKNEAYGLKGSCVLCCDTSLKPQPHPSYNIYYIWRPRPRARASELNKFE